MLSDMFGLGGLAAGAAGLAAGAAIVFFLIMIALYVYGAWALMTIARKTKTEYPWLAWIPLANLYLMTQIAGVQWWTFLIVIVAWLIPVVGGLIGLIIMLWWWWKIAEARNRPGWWGILMIVPILNLVLLGILAWGK